MNYQGALLVERMILESLAKKNKTLGLLSEDTGINENLLKIILQEMRLKGWLGFKGGEFQLIENGPSDWIGEINRSEILSNEIKELMDSIVSLYFKPELRSQQNLFKIQKLELTSDEEMLLNSHLKNLETFFQNIRSSRMKKPLKGQTKKQKVVVWASSFYEDLVGANLTAV